ncbi:DUF2256 domain-containing protein [Deinococcus aquiradiocola]|uniref:DUF2256 domain-containing protein n=1 Tax=Deinococcus aquiradiocola TaxID=393059 RepID=A0A917PIU2_9DEIO|nr:DUF2256 domain-containing protein [Deinococcus aquiradiocola]GGJ79902.1 hypothetical protein GCM10008939_24720 [Deinococcus aquiradiocola]
MAGKGGGAGKTFGGGRPPSERDSKVCPVCGRPFSWRRKWARDWPQVLYCSDRCRAAARTRPDRDAPPR